MPNGNMWSSVPLPQFFWFIFVVWCVVIGAAAPKGTMSLWFCRDSLVTMHQKNFAVLPFKKIAVKSTFFNIFTKFFFTLAQNSMDYHASECHNYKFKNKATRWGWKQLPTANFFWCMVTHVPNFGWSEPQCDGTTNGWMERWMDGLTNRRTDGHDHL